MYKQQVVNINGKSYNAANIFDNIGSTEYKRPSWERDPEWLLLPLNQADIEALDRAEVQTDQYQKLTVCFFFKNGSRRYIGLDKLSMKKAGDTIPLDFLVISRLRKLKTNKEVQEELETKKAAGDNTPVESYQYTYKIIG